MRPNLAFLLLCSSLLPLANGQDWPNWRGPNWDGSSSVEALPASFSLEEGIAWSLDLPGPGASTPVIVGDRIFLTSVQPEEGKLLAYCVDAKTGKLSWVKDAGSGYRPDGQGEATYLHDRSNYASPSAVCDDEHVFYLFGNGDLVAYTHDGEEAWRRNLQKDFGVFQFQWTFSATPTLWEGRLLLPILQRDVPVHSRGKEDAESYLLCLDPKTGEVKYRHVRPSEARVESRESYATAIPFVGKDGRKEVIVMGGDVLTGHDPATGKELWRWGTWNPGLREIWWRTVPSAVVGAGVALACAPKGAPIFAVSLGGEGNLGDAGLRWQSEGRRNPVTSDVPTPLYYKEHFYVLSDLRESLSKVKAEDGSVVWTVKMPGRFKWRSSPTGAAGRIWCMNHNGLVVGLDAETGEVVTSSQLGGEDEQHARASVAAAHGSLFIRTESQLFCVPSAGQ